MPLTKRPSAEVLSDDDPMPFGLHRGTKMKDVPAAYLDFIDGQLWIDQWPQVKGYIKANRKAIDAELGT